MRQSPHFLSIAARRSLLALPLLLLNACSTNPSGPTSASSVAVPSQWRQSAADAGPLDPASLARWWTRFDDPVLDRLIDGALVNSPDVRTALSKIAESRAVRATTKASLFPSLSAGVSGASTRTHNRNTGVTSTSESYGASLDASWEVDLFGKQLQTLSAADADLAQTAENFHAAQVSLAAEIASAYVTLRSAEARLAVVRSSLATREETLDLTRWREQAGTGAALDTLQANTSLEQTRSSIPALEQTAAQTRNQLALLSGLAPGALDTLLSSKTALPDIPATLATGIPADTLRQRPDVRAAEYAVKAAAARTSSARRERLPSLTLGGSLGVEALKAGRLFNPDSVTASVLGGLTAPIFDAGRIRQTIIVQTEQEKQALIAYESSVLSALSEVENALIAVSRTSETLAALQKAASSAREAQALAALQYKAGTIDLLSLLDTQRTTLSLEEQVVSTRADQISAHIQLYKSLGGGWSPVKTASNAP
ncbi:MAG: efflux transporter outer membrane subunit [Opitutaceae bacterium]|jgi:NodT family efflux transporter outer membrane factor (OMF) lipoprotein